MTLNQDKDRIQNEAVEAWMNNNMKGSVVVHTGFGKTFIALKALSKLPKGTRMTFLAETTTRKVDLFKEIDKYEELFHNLSDYMIEFMTYQKAYRLKQQIFDFIVADEFDVMGEQYIKVFSENSYKYALGLSGTKSSHVKYDDKTKIDLLKPYIPIVYTYNMLNAVKDNLNRDIKINIIYHKLDTNNTISVKTKKFNFKTSERKNYDYLTKSINKLYFDKTMEPSKKETLIKIGIGRRTRFMYNLPSKIKVISELLPKLKGKTVVFNNSIDGLYELNIPVLSNRQSAEKNNQIREDFDNNKIKTLGAFKMLKRGANLSNLDNLVLMSYYSNETDLIQIIGRLRHSEQVGNVYIIVTEDTVEEQWFIKLLPILEQFKQNG